MVIGNPMRPRHSDPSIGTTEMWVEVDARFGRFPMASEVLFSISVQAKNTDCLPQNCRPVSQYLLSLPFQLQYLATHSSPYNGPSSKQRCRHREFNMRPHKILLTSMFFFAAARPAEGCGRPPPYFSLGLNNHVSKCRSFLVML